MKTWGVEHPYNQLLTEITSFQKISQSISRGCRDLKALAFTLRNESSLRLES